MNSNNSYFEAFTENYKPLQSRDEEIFKDNKNWCINQYRKYTQYNNKNNQQYKEKMELYKEEMHDLLQIYKNNGEWNEKVNLRLIRSLLKIDYYNKYTLDEQIDLMIYPGTVFKENLCPSLSYLIMIVILSFKFKKDIRSIDNMTFLDPEYFIFKDKNRLKIVSVYEMINIVYNKLILRFSDIEDANRFIDYFINKTFNIFMEQ